MSSTRSASSSACSLDVLDPQRVVVRVLVRREGQGSVLAPRGEVGLDVKKRLENQTSGGNARWRVGVWSLLEQQKSVGWILFTSMAVAILCRKECSPASMHKGT